MVKLFSNAYFLFFAVVIASLCVAQTEAQSSQLCASFRAGCDRVCNDEFNTTPQSVVCKIHSPSCICKGGRSVTAYAAMRALQQAVARAPVTSSTPKTVTFVTTHTVSSPPKTITATAQDKTITVSGRATTVTVSGSPKTVVQNVTVIQPGQTIIAPGTTITTTATTTIVSLQTVTTTATTTLTSCSSSVVTTSTAPVTTTGSPNGYCAGQFICTTSYAPYASCYKWLQPMQLRCYLCTDETLQYYDCSGVGPLPGYECDAEKACAAVTSCCLEK